MTSPTDAPKPGADERRAGLTPAMIKWLERLVEHGPTKRSRGGVAARAIRAGLADWWVRNSQTGEIGLASDVIQNGEFHLREALNNEEMITPAGRAALSRAKERGNGR